MFEELRDTVTKEDFRILRESIDANVSRLDGAITKLAEAQARTEVTVGGLADGQARLAAAQARTEQRIDELAQSQAQACTEQQVGRLADVTQRLSVRTDEDVGRTFELQFRDRLTAYLGRFLRRDKVVGNDVLLDVIEPCVTTEKLDDFLRADIVAKGLVDGLETFVVVEVSSTADMKDIVRAERRATILRKAGLAAIPLVACGAIPLESIEFARRSGVRVWCDGLLVEAAA